MESNNSTPLKALAYVFLVFAAMGLVIRLVNFRNALNGLDGMDEMTYVLIARRLMLGELPYNGGFDHKPIGLYYLFALFFHAFGYTLAAIRLMPLAAIALTSWLIYPIAKKHLPAQYHPVAVYATVFMATCASFGNGGHASNTELLQMPVFAAWWLVALNWSKLRFSRALMLGALVGLAAQFNYMGGFILALSTALMLAWPLVGKVSVAALRSFSMNALLALSTFSLASVIMLLPLIMAGDLSQYFGLQFGTLSGYQGVLNEGKLLRALFSILISASFILSLLACKLWYDKSLSTYTPPQKTILLQIAAVFAVTLVVIGLTKRLYPHYFNLLVIPCTLALVFVIANVNAKTLRAFTFLAGILAALLVGRGAWDVYGKDWAENFRQQHEIAQLSQEIRNHAQPGDRVLLLNLNHTLYFLTDVVPATRFFFRSQIFLDRFLLNIGSSPMKEIHKVAATRPVYVLSCFDNIAAGYRGQVDALFSVEYKSYALTGYAECIDLKAYFLVEPFKS